MLEVLSNLSAVGIIYLLILTSSVTSLAAEGYRSITFLDNNETLTVVDKVSPLTMHEGPSHLSYIPGSSILISSEVLPHLLALLDQSRKDGVSIHVLSGYRSYYTQASLFEGYASAYGADKANTFSAKPGYSEHQLGTTVDFGGSNVDFTTDFASTPIGVWLKGNAYEYGFVQSYPEGKEGITGYQYEPWHYRYVGVENARILKESGLTLNEYQKRTIDDVSSVLVKLQLVLGLREPLE